MNKQKTTWATKIQTNITSPKKSSSNWFQTNGDLQIAWQENQNNYLNKVKENTDKQLNELRKPMDEQSKKFNKEMKTIKKNQIEILELRI